MRHLRVESLAILLLAGAGCSAVCKGPGCEDDWPATRVAVHRGAELGVGARDVWTHASGTFDGTLEEGAGWSVDAFGDQLVFGQPEINRVVLAPYRLASGPLVPSTEWIDTAASAFGASVLLGEFDGDDLFDLWITAPDHDEARGAARLFRTAEVVGGIDASSASVTLVGASPGDRLGEHMVACGDMTGDGLPEIAISAPWLAASDAMPDVPDLAGGVVLVRSDWLVGKQGRVLPADVGYVWWGENTGDGAGHAIDCDEDLTGDGIADLAIGAPWLDAGTGRVYVIAGDTLPASGSLGVAAARVLDAPDEGTWYGAALASLDLDGELPAELAVGAPGFDGGKGRVHVYPGVAVTGLQLPQEIAVIAHDPDRLDADHVGSWLLDADVDGDGIGDLLVAAPDYQDGVNGFDTGRAWLWLGEGYTRWPRAFDVSSADITITGAQPFQRVGRSALAADLDADGLDELILPSRAAAP